MYTNKSDTFQIVVKPYNIFIKAKISLVFMNCFLASVILPLAFIMEMNILECHMNNTNIFEAIYSCVQYNRDCGNIYINMYNILVWQKRAIVKYIIEGRI